ncbi:undecaprenyl-diphosphate phosphatase [Candidatus Nomurabacteria bacterium]|nr:undecaprenyl-diphosphate phosphatase [Candidatus Nomurabacteria bacterium]
MNIFQAVVLGVIQGLTEFLPVSSSGHLVFVPVLFGWSDQGLTFDVVVHLGSLLAVILYFRKRLWQLLRSLFVSEEKETRHLALILVFSIIPAGVAGLLFGDWIEANLRATSVVAWGLIFWGVMLWFAERTSLQEKKNKQVNWSRGAWIACAQALALIPGTSRSGITMTAGMFAGLSKKTAAEFSFLMSVPVILVAGAVKLLRLIETGGEGALVSGPMLFGFVAAAISGFVAIAGLMKVIQKWSFKPFVVYRIFIGVLILLFL